MSDNIVPTNDRQNEDRPPAAMVPRVAPVLANSEPVVEVSFPELWRILMKRKWMIAAVTFALFTVGLTYTLVVTPKFESSVFLDNSIQQREFRLPLTWGSSCDAR
jgi:uncharacterized protein involved in exopolysaccharide biosynthesis